MHGLRFFVLLSLVLNLSLNLNLDLARGGGLAERVIEHRLANGLTVLLVERHQSPVVSINFTFGVGGIDEHTGMTGVAHLYEHMAFKGTRTLGTKDYERERPLLEELDHINANIETHREQLRASSQDASGADSPALQQLQQAFKDAQKRADEWVIGNEMAPQMHKAKRKLPIKSAPKKAILKRTISTNRQAMPNAAKMRSKLAAT